MKRVRLETSDNLATETINPNPTKRRRIRNRPKYNHTNNGYHSEEKDSDNEHIKVIDNYIKSIESMENPDFQQCINTINKDYEIKSSEVSSQLKQTEIFINNKYEYESEIINNEYTELIDRAKKRLIAKYNEKKCKQERLFKNHFEKHLQKHSQQKSMTNDVSPIFEKDIYKRSKLIESNTENTDQFFDPILQQKWSKMRSVAENDLENDVNKLMFTQQMSQLKIKDILSSFPQCHVAYKSNENILEIGMSNDLITSNCFVLKVDSPIAIKYEGQAIMIGKVKSISSKDLWCNVRKKGNKLSDYSLCCIKIAEIEKGIVKVKLI